MEHTPKDDSDAHYDTIIVGSGAGGLASAICLARAGQKVLVLEQHDVPGGWCHSFYLNGHRFTPGVHYVGLLEEGQATSDLYRGLEIANDLVFFRMNPDGYEHVHIGNHRFDYPANLDELIERLSRRFPKEKEHIRTYLNLVQKVSNQLFSIPYYKGFWRKLTLPYHIRHLLRYMFFNLKRVVDWHIEDPLLKNILNIQCGDHGVQPRKAAFPLHCAVMNHYFQGGFYPMGGGGALIKAMTNVLKKYNGEIQTSTSVSRILIQNGAKKKAIGVQLENGVQLFAKNIISNADPGITYLELIGREHISAKLQKKLGNTKYSSTTLMLFLTVDMDLRKAGLDSGNIWMMPDTDIDEFYDGALENDLAQGDAFEGMFISFTSLKDPTSYDGIHHTIEAITLVNYDAFEKFKNENENRSDSYLRFKDVLTNKMIKGVEKAIPNVSEHIVNVELGTPITNEYYVNTTRGNIYGTEKSLKHIGPFAYKAKSEIENLYLCGASILSHGVAGASHSGVDTAAIVLGEHPDELKKPRADQHICIYPADDDSDYPEWIRKIIEVKRARAASKKQRLTI
ncbi:phytoene desaturase family protein [Maribacter algicola]|uniref:Phytoene desaturase family protein n=1 Tax=Meishania litoralis TaxID=3434685 RepID=A0ACC7LJ00_9FLAO